MATAGAVVRDPGIVHGGRFRPMPRTDGLWIVYDPLLPFGRQTVRGATFSYFDEADALARELAAALAQPSPGETRP